MANIIDDETIEYVGILAKLELSGEEKEQAKADMGRMLDYIDKLNELDTDCLLYTSEPGGRGRCGIYPTPVHRYVRLPEKYGNYLQPAAESA